jgi:hypothetical protein
MKNYPVARITSILSSPKEITGNALPVPAEACVLGVALHDTHDYDPAVNLA